jgi:hypothetical protein
VADRTIMRSEHRRRVDDSVLRFLQEGDDMLSRYRRELLGKIIDRFARLQVIEQGCTGTLVPWNTALPPITSAL